MRPATQGAGRRGVPASAPMLNMQPSVASTVEALKTLEGMAGGTEEVRNFIAELVNARIASMTSPFMTVMTRPGAPSHCDHAELVTVPRAAGVHPHGSVDLLRNLLRDAPVDGAGAAEPLVALIQGVPKSWTMGEIMDLLKAAAICTHCDLVGVPIAVGDDLQIRLHSGDALQKCLGLEGKLVQHPLGLWPLHVRARLQKPNHQAHQAHQPRRAHGAIGGAVGVPLPELAMPRKEGTRPRDERQLLKMLMKGEQAEDSEDDTVEDCVEKAQPESLSESRRRRWSAREAPEPAAPAPGHWSDALEAPEAAPAPEVPKAPEEGEGAEGCELTTTYVISGIPTEWDGQTVLSVLWKYRFGGTVDFFYLPQDFASKCNKGYAFVNFRDHLQGERFQRILHGKVLTRHGRFVKVLRAQVQGFHKNVTRFLKRQGKRIRHQDCLPLVFPTGDSPGLPLCEQSMPEEFWRAHVLSQTAEEAELAEDEGAGCEAEAKGGHGREGRVGEWAS